jgi:hypothetical protein
MRATVNRFAWPAGSSVASAKLEFSQDNGLTWPNGVQINLDGGQLAYKGLTDGPSSFTVGIENPSSTSRLVRGSLVLNASLDCGAVVEGF